MEGTFEGRSAVNTWLHRIVTRTAIDAMRKRAVELRASPIFPSRVVRLCAARSGG
jgi:DNA-directed RNA polymerase specialized sigma24 family protein